MESLAKELYPIACKRILNDFHIDLTEDIPQTSIKSCNKCLNIKSNPNTNYIEKGLNAVTINYYLLHYSKYKDSICFGRDDDEEGYRLCSNFIILEQMLDVAHQAEQINRIIMKVFGIRKNKANEKLSNEQIIDSLFDKSKAEANKIFSTITDGLSRLLNQYKDKSIVYPHGVNVSDIKGATVLHLHGHQLKDLVDDKNYCLFQPQPDVVIVGHFHRLFCAKYKNSLICFSGHLTSLTHSFKNTIMPSAGAIAYLISSKYDIKLIINRMWPLEDIP
jgi:hypothetical protein